MVLEKNIDQTSKYYQKDRPYLSTFQVANEGRSNQLFVIGDSHAVRLSYRFQQLYFDSKTANKTDQFPTVVTMALLERPLNAENYLLQFSIDMIKKHRPKRVLFLCHWFIYYCRNYPECNYGKFETDIKELVEKIKEVQALGVELFTQNIELHY